MKCVYCVYNLNEVKNPVRCFSQSRWCHTVESLEPGSSQRSAVTVGLEGVACTPESPLSFTQSPGLGLKEINVVNDMMCPLINTMFNFCLYCFTNHQCTDKSCRQQSPSIN